VPDLVRQFFVRDVMVKPVAPSHRIARRREADNKSKHRAHDDPSDARCPKGLEVENISHAKPQSRKALPRFERVFFAPLRLCARNIYPVRRSWMHLSTFTALPQKSSHSHRALARWKDADTVEKPF
jgi:hypothetical protein